MEMQLVSVLAFTHSICLSVCVTKKVKLFTVCCCLIVSSGLRAVAVCGVHGRAGLGAPAEDVQLAEDRGDLLLQHEPHQAAVVSNLAGHRRPLQQGWWSRGFCHLTCSVMCFRVLGWHGVCLAVLPCSSVHFVLSCNAPLRTWIYCCCRNTRRLFNYVLAGCVQADTVIYFNVLKWAMFGATQI